MDKFNEIFNISSLILDKYAELLTMKDGSKDSLIREIRSLVLEEYKLFHQLTLEDATDIISKLDCIAFGDCVEVIERINIKLKNLIDEYQNSMIKCSEFGISYLPVYMNVSLYDAIVSMTHIDTIKSLKIKIDSLNITNDGDRRFVNSLNKHLEESKRRHLYWYSLSEIISLSYSGNIDMIPRIDLTKIKERLKQVKQIDEKSCNHSVATAIMSIAEYVINDFAKINKLDNNPKDIFRYLSYVTEIEVLISYMDCTRLEELEKYCNRLINDRNAPSLNNIKRLIRKKNKD